MVWFGENAGIDGSLVSHINPLVELYRVVLLYPWICPSLPWQYVHLDFTGLFHSNQGILKVARRSCIVFSRTSVPKIIDTFENGLHTQCCQTSYDRQWVADCYPTCPHAQQGQSVCLSSVACQHPNWQISTLKRDLWSISGLRQQ